MKHKRNMSVDITNEQRDILVRFSRQTGVNTSTILAQGALLYMLDYLNRVTHGYKMLEEELKEAWRKDDKELK